MHRGYGRGIRVGAPPTAGRARAVPGWSSGPTPRRGPPRSGSPVRDGTPARTRSACAIKRIATSSTCTPNLLRLALNSLFKAEPIRNKGPWTGINDVEVAVAEYVDWRNQRRLHGELGHITPAEHKAAHYGTEPPASLQRTS
ncbi:IS3 family transposase [Streptomyces arboris]|uniref:IS3 family transposase n=1 Tax=Streptomyces arboris TaxID=2600619 RepID=UPI003BF60A75